jgi:hypothetical protein
MRVVAVCAVCTVLSSCITVPEFLGGDSPIANNRAEAGKVYVAAYPPLAWQEIVEELKPNFMVGSANEVLDDVLPVTSVEDFSTLRSSGASIEANFAGTSVTKNDAVTTERKADGSIVQSGTNTRTEKLDPASRPTPSGEAPLSAGDFVPSLPAGAPPAQGAFGYDVDPFLKYRTATALYQEIKLLNKYLGADVSGEGYTPYLFRVQVSLQPYAHHQPIDVYTTLEVNPADDSFPYIPSFRNHEIRVIPLLVTDNMERSNSRRVARAAAQLDAKLSALSNGIGFGAGWQAIQDELQAMAGSEFNSLLTIGQSASNQLTVRLGAATSTKSDFEMLPRSYDVTFLVLWPDERKKSAQIRSSTSFRNARTGALLPLMPQAYMENLRTRLKAALGKADFKQDEIKETLRLLDTDDLYAPARYLQGTERGTRLWKARDTIFNDEFGMGRPVFNNGVLENEKPPKPTKDEIEDNADLKPILDLLDSHVEAVGESSTSNVDLPKLIVAMPPQQTAVLQDNPSGHATVRLSGTSGLTSEDRLFAFLVVTPPTDYVMTANPKLADVQSMAEEGGVVFAADEIAIEPGGQLVLSFPSPTAHELREKIEAGEAAIVFHRYGEGSLKGSDSSNPPDPQQASPGQLSVADRRDLKSTANEVVSVNLDQLNDDKRYTSVHPVLLNRDYAAPILPPALRARALAPSVAVKDTAGLLSLVVDLDSASKVNVDSIFVTVQNAVLTGVKKVITLNSAEDLDANDIKPTLNGFRIQPNQAYQVGVSGMAVTTGSTLQVQIQALDVAGQKIPGQSGVLVVPLVAVPAKP